MDEPNPIVTVQCRLEVCHRVYSLFERCTNVTVTTYLAGAYLVGIQLRIWGQGRISDKFCRGGGANCFFPIVRYPMC